MRMRLLLRRLTVSSPRMSVRSSLPWPLRWAVGALVLGFSAALALWAFEFGKDIAGLDRHTEREFLVLRAQVDDLTVQLAKAQEVANTSQSLLTTEQVAQEQLGLQIKQLQSDNEMLRSDLGFFERLLPSAGGGALNIRGLQAERISPAQYKWQVLIIQAAKNSPEFSGTIQVSLSGTLNGKPWSINTNAVPEPVVVRSYLRKEGLIEVPQQAVIKSITAQIERDGSTVSVHTTKL
jgi:hypothetical protein